MSAGSDGDPIHLALDAIGRVHGDGPLPRTIVHRRRLRPSRQGYYDSVAAEIVVNEGTKRPAVTMLHEVGHVIDLHGLGASKAFASVADSALHDWRRTVGASQAFQTLSRLRRTVVEPDKARYLRYLLLPEEVWARSYAQYVVTSSVDLELQRQLDTMRLRRPGQALYIPRYWHDGDFVPVAAEIDRLFERRGWIV